MVNGNAKGWVKAFKGLRQGDPLSSFLSTLVADILSRLMIKAKETRITEGFFVGRDKTIMSSICTIRAITLPIEDCFMNKV